MKTLILMRHAKAAPQQHDQPDIDRPLAQRGTSDAKAIGDWIRKKGLVPDIAIVSSAERTQQTWEALGLEAETPMKSASELYDAVPSTYLGILSRLDCDTVLMIGHNPTVATLAEHLLRDVDVPLDLTAYPTGATMAIAFEGDTWDSAVKLPGKLVHWAIPRELFEQD
ncbi:SixA phosphatase family protein [Oceanibium sediminis]|uniref:SixA phosphatase family protein n=1 Tax=Oceanibium sediminis TaxID=2026339 RepID=UPI000DD36108|nr:histidine phosphatase family protein [Oceanibium sediminis]